MNRKIKLSLITLLSVGCISVASLPLVSCGNSETTSKPDVVITGITLIATPSLTYGELLKDSITLSTAQKVFNGIDETNYEQFEISMSSWTGQVTMDLTAKEGFVFSDNKNILKSNSFLYPASPTQPKDHSFKTADGINISAKANGTASIIESSATYTGADLVINDSYVSSTDSVRYGITSIGDYAFYNSKLTTLDLSKNTSLTTIGGSAFTYSKLTTLDLTKNTSLTSIGNGAFSRSKLTTLILPTSLTNIGGGAFRSSTPTTLIIPNLVTYIGDDAFASTRILESNLQIPVQFGSTEALARIGITIIT